MFYLFRNDPTVYRVSADGYRYEWFSKYFNAWIDSTVYTIYDAPIAILKHRP